MEQPRAVLRFFWVEKTGVALECVVKRWVKIEWLLVEFSVGWKVPKLVAHEEFVRFVQFSMRDFQEPEQHDVFVRIDEVENRHDDKYHSTLEVAMLCDDRCHSILEEENLYDDKSHSTPEVEGLPDDRCHSTPEMAILLPIVQWFVGFDLTLLEPPVL